MNKTFIETKAGRQDLQMTGKEESFVQLVFCIVDIGSCVVTFLRVEAVFVASTFHWALFISQPSQLLANIPASSHHNDDPDVGYTVDEDVKHDGQASDNDVESQ